MATNLHMDEGRYLFLEVGAGVESGDAVAVENIVGVAMIDADGDDFATIDTEGVYMLPVIGNDGSAAAGSVGDIVYIQSNGTLNLNDAGTQFGLLLADVTSGQTETVPVKINGV